MKLNAHVVAALAALAVAGRLGAADKPDPVDCPMHAAHQAASKDNHQVGVDTRHDHATGVGHADSVHHFSLDPEGGVIRLEVKDSADIAGRDRIRTHLSSIAGQFAEGRFDVPTTIHDRVPPGVPAMQRLKAAIRYRYEPTDKGGRVAITTGNSEARAAVHEFLRFQIEDHGTDDPREVAPRH